jgi:hypothetical protein
MDFIVLDELGRSHNPAASSDAASATSKTRRSKGSLWDADKGVPFQRRLTDNHPLNSPTTIKAATT